MRRRSTNCTSPMSEEKRTRQWMYKTTSGLDVIKFDRGLSRIYVACYSGAIAVFHQGDPDHYRKVEDFRVQHAVHTLAVDLKTHRVYTPEQEEDVKPVARMVVYEAVTNP